MNSSTIDQQAVELPPTGVIKDLAMSFSNERDARCLTDFKQEVLQDGALSYFRRYRQSYFSGPFIAGQGAELILQAINDWHVSGTAIDLGAGTSSLFWYLPATRISKMWCSDISPEALFLLKELVDDHETLPECYRWVAQTFNITVADVLMRKASINSFFVFDCLTEWPRAMPEETFDLVTAFGCLGISRSEQAYANCFKQIAKRLSFGGRTIGADWIKRDSIVGAGDDNGTYLNACQVSQALLDAGLSPLLCLESEIADDPLYHSIVVWVGEKPA